MALIERPMASGPPTLPELVQRTGFPAERLRHGLTLPERRLPVEPGAQGRQVPCEGTPRPHADRPDR